MNSGDGMDVQIILNHVNMSGLAYLFPTDGENGV